LIELSYLSSGLIGVVPDLGLEQHEPSPMPRLVMITFLLQEAHQHFVAHSASPLSNQNQNQNKTKQKQKKKDPKADVVTTVPPFLRTLR